MISWKITIMITVITLMTTLMRDEITRPSTRHKLNKMNTPKNIELNRYDLKECIGIMSI